MIPEPETDPANIAHELTHYEREVLFALCYTAPLTDPQAGAIDRVLREFVALGIVNRIITNGKEFFVASPFGWDVAAMARGPLQ